MIAYWVIFLMPALLALTLAEKGPRPGRERVPLTPAWIAAWIMLVVVVGFRHYVGGDWMNYLRHYTAARGMGLAELIAQSDPGYQFISWLSLALDLDIWGVNTIGAIIFATGLLAFCRSLSRPWLGFAVAVPYLVIVVAMGYTRQGIALGFALLGLLAFGRRSVVMFAFWILVAATVHRSALVLLPIAALATPRNRVWTGFWIGILCVVGYLSFIESDVESLYSNYVATDYQSEGALVRSLMNAVPGAIFLSRSRQFPLSPAALGFWRWVALLSIGLLVAVIASPGTSAALDRLGLYFLPLQVMVFSCLPTVFASGRRRTAWVLAVLAYYAAILLVWLNFGANAYAWRPYGSFLL